MAPALKDNERTSRQAWDQAAIIAQISGVLRIAVPALLLVFFGDRFNHDQMGELTNQIIAVAIGIVTIVMMVWSVVRFSKQSQIAATSQLEGVHAVLAEPHIANEGTLAENPRVVSLMSEVPEYPGKNRKAPKA